VKAVRAANLAVRFLLEVGALVALAYWGFSTGSGAGAWALGLAAPAAFAAAWGLFVAPKRKVRTSEGARLAIELALFALVAVALAASASTAVALVFGAVALSSGVLDRVMR